MTAPESSSPLDLEAIRARYDDYCERSLNEDDVYDAAMQCADDVPALLAALEEVQRERDELRNAVASAQRQRDVAIGALANVRDVVAAQDLADDRDRLNGELQDALRRLDYAWDVESTDG
jgi:hypothetical protein